MGLNISALKTEITDDPKLLGLASLGDKDVSIKLNEIGASSEMVDTLNVSNGLLQNAVIGSEFILLDANRQRLWLSILSSDSIEVKNSNIRGQILSVWGAGTTTRDNLSALQTRSGSRAEVLFGNGVRITQSEVQRARKL